MHYILAAIIRYDENETEKVMEYLADAKPNFIQAVMKQLEPQLIQFSVDNPTGVASKFDEWDIDDIITTEDFLTNLPEMESIPQAVLTPALEWVDSDKSHSGSRSGLWEDKIKKVVLTAGDSCLIVLIRCHI